jgi:hypothetical protein
MFNWITIGEIKHVFIVLYPAQTFVGFLFDTINTKTKGTRFVAVFFISCTLDSWCRFLIKKKKISFKNYKQPQKSLPRKTDKDQDVPHASFYNQYSIVE